MVMTRCPTCQEFDTGIFSHKCKPRFECYLVDGAVDTEEEGYRVHAIDPQGAAESFLHSYDDRMVEFPDEPRTVAVKDADGTVHTFTVTWEARRDYRARLVN